MGSGPDTHTIYFVLVHKVKWVLLLLEFAFLFLVLFSLPTAWHCLPNKMKDWLTNDCNTDPFADGQLLDAQGIADHMQRYYNKFYKNK